MAINIKVSGVGKDACVTLKGIDGSSVVFTEKVKSAKVDNLDNYIQGIEALKSLGLNVVVEDKSKEADKSDEKKPKEVANVTTDEKVKAPEGDVANDKNNKK